MGKTVCIWFNSKELEPFLKELQEGETLSARIKERALSTSEQYFLCPWCANKATTLEEARSHFNYEVKIKGRGKESL